MPKFSSTQYAQALYDAVTETNPKDHDKVLDSFVKVLAQTGDLGKYEEIEAEYLKLEMKAKGMSAAEITVAQKDIEVNSSLIKELNEMIGTKMEMKKKVDDGIVGGVILRVDDTIIDASVKTQLDNLNKELKQ